jgi:two-component system CheB/CheR fusion protein
LTTTPDRDYASPLFDSELSETKQVLSNAQENLDLVRTALIAIERESFIVAGERQSADDAHLAAVEGLRVRSARLTAASEFLQHALVPHNLISSDLQNVLNSMDVATFLLDRTLKIRLFTPAAKLLFNVIPSDIGRPLSDLSPLAPDESLVKDAYSVLVGQGPVQREITSQNGSWFLRRMLPYRTHTGEVEGLVITYTDVTDRKLALSALASEKSQADAANKAKSRFLAAASHDLRQPLQALKLVQGMLARIVEGEAARVLVDRLDSTLSGMATMLNALLDINQIEAGIVRADTAMFTVNDLFERIRDEFTIQASDQDLRFTIVPCDATIQSDPGLLEQMLRNLLSNAFKYTKSGRVLLGARRRAGGVSIEVWDTGVGIPNQELTAIFEEYHQLDNPARERHRGLGLGLSIVRRLGNLLGHNVRVKSLLGRGSVFAIDVIVPEHHIPASLQAGGSRISQKFTSSEKHTGAILIIEDEEEVRDLLSMILQQEGHRTLVAQDGVAAVEMVARGCFRPDLILADYNLPNGMNGVAAVTRLRAMTHHHLPAIILTGDISTNTLREISSQKCVMRNKPVKASDLTEEIQRLLQNRNKTSKVIERLDTLSLKAPVVFLVDDDDNVRDLIRTVLESDGLEVEDFASSEDFLAAFELGRDGCLLVDAYLPGMSGLELLHRLKADGCSLPSVMITGFSDVSMAVEAMKAGASDFIEKPLSREDLIGCVDRAFRQSRDAHVVTERFESATAQLANLTPRQHQIMEMVVAGHPSKIIAANLQISQRTVENHRAVIMKKTGSRSLPALARLSLESKPHGVDG